MPFKQLVSSFLAAGAGIFSDAPASMTSGSWIPFALARSQTPTPAVAAMEDSVSPSAMVTVVPAAVVEGVVELDAVSV
ncbi:hypothetical protein M3J09_013193 [Ascochyta lentis]